MKKIISFMTISILMVALFAEGTKFKVVADTELYSISWDGINFDKTGVKVLKGDEIEVVSSDIYNNPKDKTLLITVANKKYIDVSKIAPEKAKTTLDTDILTTTLNSNDMCLVSEKFYEAVNQKDRNYLLTVANQGYLNYQKNKTDMDNEWYEILGTYAADTKIYNISLSLSGVFSLYQFIIKDIVKINNGYQITAVVDYYREFEKQEYPIPKAGDEVTLKLIPDGDYVHFYLNNNLLETYIITTKAASRQIISFLWKGTCDYSAIPSPQHGKKTDNVKKAESNTNVSVKKEMTAQENLKLRSGEATSSEVLTVMSAGTKVKILELGKAETIDGISSNWVKVEVQKNAKDRDGKPIKAGTVGWCYGGYLQ